MFPRYLDFCPDFFDHVEKRLDKKAKANFKIYDVTEWEKNKLLNISRIKGNQTIKFGRLIEDDMRNIFLEKWYTKCGG